MAKYLDSKADVTFKKVFGEHKNLVTSLLNALLPLDEGKQVESKVRLQALMKCGAVEYVWSDALDYELGQSPNFQEPDMIAPWKANAVEMVMVDDVVIARGEEIERYGLKAMDAIHIACAETAACDWFLTTDKGITRKLHTLGDMRIANPVDFILEG